jgi:MerR family transcriptional regulator, light-induced transcriptional regulator
MPNSKSYSLDTRANHRIGAVSALSGVPVPTLRVWETRYAAFSPRLTSGQQRIYSDDDVLRATLLKRLTDQGHTISSIANHNATRLNDLLQHQSETHRRAVAKTSARHAANVAVVGLPLAARLASKKFKQIAATLDIETTDIYPDIETALASTPTAPPQFLMVRVNSLHALVQVELHRLIERSAIPQVIVLYHFGQEQVVESMKRAGMVVRREPVSDYELADLIGAAMLMDVPQVIGRSHVGATIPPRKYDDATLAYMAGISTNVLCECPRHVAEIIAQLVSFEQYSQECLNKSSEDAHLHAYLHSVSGSARALFESALQRVAEHEGLELNNQTAP